MKRVLVTGANGFVGQAVCKELVDNGYSVTGLYRSENNLEYLKKIGVNLAQGDIRDVDSLEKCFPNIDILFHIAALFRQAKFPDSVYRDINVTGVENVLKTAIQFGVKKVVHCSTVGVHSHIPNPPANESEEYRPGDIYQETKCEGEQLSLEYFRSRKINGCVIRPAMIWGPADSRTQKIFKGIANRKIPLIGTGKTYVHWILVSDLARAFRLAAEKPNNSGEIYIIAGEKYVTMEHMLCTIAECFNVKPPKVKIPALPIQILGDIVEKICVPFNIEPPIYRRRVDFYTKTRAFDSSKASKELGFVPANSFEDEVKLIAESYKQFGWI